MEGSMYTQTHTPRLTYTHLYTICYFEHKRLYSSPIIIVISKSAQLRPLPYDEPVGRWRVVTYNCLVDWLLGSRDCKYLALTAMKTAAATPILQSSALPLRKVKTSKNEAIYF